MIDRMKMDRMILEQLDRIEKFSLLGAKDALTMDDAVVYTGLSKSYLYRLTHLKKIPYYKSVGGKQLYFAKRELNEWLLHHRVQATEEAEQAAAAYVVNNPRNGREGGVR